MNNNILLEFKEVKDEICLKRAYLNETNLNLLNIFIVLDEVSLIPILRLINI